ncbi:hydroxyisourate hydrolase [Candidatus Pelagisphaera phototrophica]|uniref:hydroxyisourate hydrolase n=1 Tax=Candidatus Pelagisphaera phototrophica TaxID=2684113 RepID=UPI0019E64B6D|nr:hydroxyisourate hydrolase [Candidatus Pelagisphaera phototrophica]QXD31379.1 hydroxyisourate hydrolase [Candidatus Pelagisphaera phototrophica]|tara:strand:- start:2792 stop:3145 length:354 start_codon:yes stop_codon:yes gene_type:complete
MSGKLSTHILDNYHGRPASGVDIELYRDNGDAYSPIGRFQTNQDGRTDALLLDKDSLLTGSYRLVFKVGPYFRKEEVELPKPSFLENVSIDVNLQAGESYHVPLLCTPWSYSTYRGS